MSRFVGVKLRCLRCNGNGWLPDPKSRVDGWPVACPACGGVIDLSIRQLARRIAPDGLDEGRLEYAIRRILKDRVVRLETASTVLDRLASYGMLGAPSKTSNRRRTA